MLLATQVLLCEEKKRKDKASKYNVLYKLSYSTPFTVMPCDQAPVELTFLITVVRVLF